MPGCVEFYDDTHPPKLRILNDVHERFGCVSIQANTAAKNSRGTNTHTHTHTHTTQNKPKKKGGVTTLAEWARTCKMRLNRKIQMQI